MNPKKAPYFDDNVLNEILKQEAGKGPKPWSHFRTRYCGFQRSHKSNKKFTRSMLKYAEKLPHRIIIERPYNISEDPTVEILNG